MDEILVIPYKVIESKETKDNSTHIDISLVLSPSISSLKTLEKDLEAVMVNQDGVILFQNEVFTKVEKDFSKVILHGSSTVGGTSFFEILRICEKQLNRRF